MSDVIDLSTLPEDQRAAYYGILFAMAAADGTFDAQEMGVIHSLLETEAMTAANRRKVAGWHDEPPALAECLAVLAGAGDELRFGVLVALVDIALVDHVLDAMEMKALESACSSLEVSPSQFAAIRSFVETIKRVRNRGVDDAAAAESIRKAAAKLAEADIPLSAAYFCGSAHGLGAAGLESARDAIGIGLGMVPGMGVGVFIGSTVRVSVSQLLKPDQATGPTRSRYAKTAEHALVNLETTINELVGQADKTHDPALVDRVAGLKQLLATRRSALEEG